MPDRIALTETEIEAIVERTVKKTLLTLGLDTTDPLETQRDLQWVRDWRGSVDLVRGYSIRAAVSILVVGTLGAIWYAVTHGFGGK